MKQIYRFDRALPPPLSEKSLRAEIERRKTQRYAAILALAGILANCCFALAAFLLYPVNAIFSIACVSYVIISICGGGIVAAVYSNNRRNLT